MNNLLITNLLETLSLMLVISYFLLNKINLVIIGIILAIVLLNKIIIFKSINYLKSNLFTPMGRKINNDIKSETIKTESNKEESNLTLVETIEELGFIPSQEKDTDSNAA